MEQCITHVKGKAQNFVNEDQEISELKRLFEQVKELEKIIGIKNREISSKD